MPSVKALSRAVRPNNNGKTSAAPPVPRPPAPNLPPMEEEEDFSLPLDQEATLPLRAQEEAAASAAFLGAGLVAVGLSQARVRAGARGSVEESERRRVPEQ